MSRGVIDFYKSLVVGIAPTTDEFERDRSPIPARDPQRYLKAFYAIAEQDKRGGGIDLEEFQSHFSSPLSSRGLEIGGFHDFLEKGLHQAIREGASLEYVASAIEYVFNRVSRDHDGNLEAANKALIGIMNYREAGYVREEDKKSSKTSKEYLEEMLGRKVSLDAGAVALIADVRLGKLKDGFKAPGEMTMYSNPAFTSRVTGDVAGAAATTLGGHDSRSGGGGRGGVGE